jgi:hypothetical protein
MLLRGISLLHSFIALSGIVPAEASPAASVQTKWQTQLPNTPSDWRKHVRSPKSQVIKPIAIVSNLTEGNVTNPEGLLKNGRGATILTRPAPSNVTWALGPSPPDITPVLVVDFGQNVAGFLSIKFTGASNSTPGLPGIRLGFSESIQYGYLTNFSDFSRSYNVSL